MIARADGGPDDLSNIVTLCSSCHDYVEVQGFRTYSAIVGSFGKDLEYTEPDEERPPDPISMIDRNRPDFHKYVYGGIKRRNKR